MMPPDRPLPDPAARPRSLAQRLQLLLLLLVLPAAVVALPTLLVTHIFGRRPQPKAIRATPTPDTSGLAAALGHSAESLLPTPAPLAADTIRVTVRADHLAARADKVANQAKLLGGSAVEGVSTANEKHLFVDLPAGRADAFRVAVTQNDAPIVPDVTPVVGAARDQVEVVIRPAADDE